MLFTGAKGRLLSQVGSSPGYDLKPTQRLRLKLQTEHHLKAAGALMPATQSCLKGHVIIPHLDALGGDGEKFLGVSSQTKQTRDFSGELVR